MADVMGEVIDLDTTKIQRWQSIFTLIVFVLANITVLFPSHIPIPIPVALYGVGVKGLVYLRVIPARKHYDQRSSRPSSTEDGGRVGGLVSGLIWFRFPINFVTGPLIADLFLLAIGSIGKKEVEGGIAGSDNIVPYDILIFFFSLAYIAISIDASGLIRYLAFRVLQLGGKVGHRLFFFLYAFFFGLGSFIGNDPIILSGTAFLAYMTRVSSNIVHPRAWIHTQFAVANIASAILVSSNPTNLVLAGAFKIKFIDYTRDMVVPVVITAVLLFPFLLYIIFANESLIPSSITMHELDAEARARKPVNPNIPFGRGTAGEEEKQLANNEAGQLLSLEEIMNPFLDKAGAAFGGVIMAATLITILILNEVQSSHNKETRVFYVTLPAATVMLVFDLVWGWIHREETRKIARDGRQQIAEDAERKRRQLAAEAGVLERGEDLDTAAITMTELHDENSQASSDEKVGQLNYSVENMDHSAGSSTNISPSVIPEPGHGVGESLGVGSNENTAVNPDPSQEPSLGDVVKSDERFSPDGGAIPPRIECSMSQKRADTQSTEGIEEEKNKNVEDMATTQTHVSATPTANSPSTLVSISVDAYRWLQDTFPTVVAVLSHLPFALLPFSFEMFILVQGLVTNGWVPVFAYGWDHWVSKTGTIGAIGGMGFLSVILCNFAGTNIGTTILLSRVIQAWEAIHVNSMQPLGDRTKWATIYAMALGVNYGAFSIAFSASLAGLLWRDILARKHIRVRGYEFARVNLPIISIAMTIGLAVLVGEVYIFRRD
ncbi:putative arsenite efflux transporter - puative [Rosellinia necatrix]|uniref:Putative arsenite efflux transporter-puative n=1 Tax=Rosellinia necatrix TaxID=77044 RepID=A0A1W2TJK5_ROSNE|nr:putative arsenite efflux transporter - puative [Rosellinia necatrix]